jgi:hypothetical protein
MSNRETAWNVYAEAAGPSDPVAPWREGNGRQYPFGEEINLLPDRFRRYPRGDVRTIADLREQVAALSRLVEHFREEE